MALYVSDYTKFMSALLEQHPEWVEDQLVGRSLLWDKKVDLTEQQKLRESNEVPRSYPYDVFFDKF